MNGAIPFPLDQAAAPATLTYRPWGVRTLKLQLSTATAVPALRLRPRAVRPEEASVGLFRAYADDSNAFHLSWGGGHEPGPCLKAEDYLLAFERCVPLKPEDSSIIYFNVAHVGPDAPAEAVVTVDAYDEQSGQAHASLTVRLQRPPDYGDGAVRLLPADDGRWQPVGDRAPVYDPRWWPGPVRYEPLDAPPLQLRVAGDQLQVHWADRLVARITDHTRPSVLTPERMVFELFAFDQWHLALRTWFFWLDTRIGGGHEVPDAERFDMLLRRRDGYITLACTDLHWREMWGQVADAPLQATLGLSGAAKLKLVREGINKIAALFRGEEKDAGAPAAPYVPVAGYIPRQAARLGSEPSFRRRAKGAEAHIPTLENLAQLKEDAQLRMTSSDVRLG